MSRQERLNGVAPEMYDLIKKMHQFLTGRCDDRGLTLLEILNRCELVFMRVESEPARNPAVLDSEDGDK